MRFWYEQRIARGVVLRLADPGFANQGLQIVRQVALPGDACFSDVPKFIEFVSRGRRGIATELHGFSIQNAALRVVSKTGLLDHRAGGRFCGGASSRIRRPNQ